MLSKDVSIKRSISRNKKLRKNVMLRSLDPVNNNDIKSTERGAISQMSMFSISSPDHSKNESRLMRNH